jgi:hypothetical protein
MYRKSVTDFFKVSVTLYLKTIRNEVIQKNNYRVDNL